MLTRCSASLKSRAFGPSFAALLLVSMMAGPVLGQDPGHDQHSKAGQTATTNMKSAGSSAIHEVMQKGMNQMHSMAMTGDTDHDFATMMIAHHKQAIEMSQAQLKHGKDQMVRQKAQEIIAASEKDIKDLQSWTKQHKPSKQASAQ
jgi:uncharacterized protein (DUF305 family)